MWQKGLQQSIHRLNLQELNQNYHQRTNVAKSKVV